MKMRRSVPVGVVAILCSVLCAEAAFGQTPLSGSIIATAQIPYEFTVDGTLLPAGEYSLTPIAPSVMLFWNAKAKVGEQAFLLSTGDSISSDDCKLVFVEHEGEHYLRSIWSSGAKQVLIFQFYVPLAAGDVRTEVKLSEPGNKDQALQARQ
jgi:hypothetical protein